MNGADRYAVLIVEEDARERGSFAAAAEKVGCRTVQTAGVEEALNCLLDEAPHVVVAPMRSGGMRLLRAVRAAGEETAVILTVEPNQLDRAAAARLMEDGAHDFLVKPVDTVKLGASVQKALRDLDISRQNSALRRQIESPSAQLGFTGKSPRMQEVYRSVIRLAASPGTTGLIMGESGVGKEVAARAVHTRSVRRKGPFVPFNCAALPEALIESELFGHEQGAFTGAERRRRGRFELADGGTLLLDEIGEMPLAQQSKLLRALETREFERVGGEKMIRVDVRIIATTNRDLELEVEEGRFRGDLYHRLRVWTIRIPPLRERVEDIPLLTRHFIDHFAEETGAEASGIKPEAMRALEKYPWHGNVRELKNCIEVMVVTAQGSVLGLSDLPEWILQSGRPTPPSDAETDEERMHVTAGMPWSEIEKEAIRATLEYTGGNKAEAARVLEISRRTLFRKIKTYGL